MSYIAKIYVDLIRKKEKTIEDVPELLKEEVQKLISGDKGDA